MRNVIITAIAAAAIVGALGIILARSVFHSALFLVITLASIAGIFVILGADFLAAVQVLVYVGAVNVLILFAIMLVNKKETLAEIPGLALRRVLSGAVCIGLFLLLLRVALTTPWALPGPVPVGEEATARIGETAPDFTLTSDTGTSASDGITNATTLTFDLVFDEKVTGLASTDFTRTGSATGCGTPSVAANSGYSPSGSGYTISLAGCSEGTVTLTLGVNTVADVATNAGPTSSASASATIDRTGPVGCTLVIAVSYVGVNLLVDLAYGLADPRVRIGGGRA